jgi:hypothetical protein
LKRILRRGIKRRLFPATLDMDTAMALLLGPLLYGHVFHRGMQPGRRDLGQLAAESFWRAHSVGREGQQSGTAKVPRSVKAQRSPAK